MRCHTITAAVAILLGGAVIAHAEGTSQPQSAADTGQQIKGDAEKAGSAIKDGAVKVGETVEHDAVKVGETVKNGAIDLWEAGKAAVGAGSTTFSKRRAARDEGRDPDAPPH
jgi:hypothetical protein